MSRHWFTNTMVVFVDINCPGPEVHEKVRRQYYHVLQPSMTLLDAPWPLKSFEVHE